MAEVADTGKNVAWFKDAAERIFWTAAEVAVAGAITASAELEGWLVIPIATALAGLKSVVAKHVGSEEDASIGGT